MKLEFKKLLECFSILSIFAIIMQPLIGMTAYYIIIIVQIMLCICDTIRRGKISIGFYEIQTILMVMLEFISKLYSIENPATNYVIKTTVINFLIIYSIINNFGLKQSIIFEKIIDLLDKFVLMTVLISVYLLIFELPEIIGTRIRLGYQLYKNYGTYMTLSYILIISDCYMIWKFFYTKKNIKFYLFSIILLIISFISGTRKTLICPIIFLLIILMYKYRKNIIKLIMIIFMSMMIILTIYKVTITNQYLYKISGQRLENFLKSKTSENIDMSINERSLLKQLATEAFLEKPLLGWGGNSFARYSLNHNGPYLYSHCNYLELLCTLGIIGFVLFYSLYIYILYNSYKGMKKCDDFSLLIFAFMIMTIISDYGTVSYYSIYYMFMMLLFTTYLENFNKKEK